MTLKDSYKKYLKYRPPFPFSGAYTSTILSKLRIPLHRSRIKHLISKSRREIFTSKKGFKLSLYINDNDNFKKTLFVLPGYLSHHNTSYMQTALEEFYKAGWNVIRINPIDHGDSLSLNKEVFHAHHHKIVAECIDQYSSNDDLEYSLLGFSFGGNFAIRIGALDVGRKLQRVVGVCPMVDHDYSLDTMKSSFFKWYYRNKWLKTFKYKNNNWEDFDYSQFYKIKDFKEVTARLLPNILPEYKNISDYFKSYKITSEIITLSNSKISIIASKNDPVVPISTFSSLKHLQGLNLIITDFGGHNGFIENYRFDDYSIKIAMEELMT